MGANRDYKYVIVDMTKVNIGVKYQVNELVDDVRVPVKFVALVRKLIPIEEQEGLSLDTHFYQIEENTYPYLMWKQLGLTMKFQNLFPSKKRRKEIYESECFSFEEGIKRMKEDALKEQSFLIEIQFSKTKLTMLGL